MSLRDPYQQVPLICYDGIKKNTIKIFGQNEKNRHQFTIGWDIPQQGKGDKCSSKVGNATGFILPEYTVITYRDMKKNKNLPIEQRNENKFATIAQRNLGLDSQIINQKEFIVNQSIENNIKKIKQSTNQQIQEILEKQRRENRNK